MIPVIKQDRDRPEPKRKRNNLKHKIDNTKRKAAILIILKSEDLLTLITKVRSKPIETSSNPNGYSPKRCIINIKGEEETINSDDEYLYRHDILRCETL